MPQLPPARIGDPVPAIDTPALVLDLDPFERNLDLMANAARGGGVALRPHAKAHKCPDIARIVAMVAGKLLARGLALPSLARSLGLIGRTQGDPRR